ncbi:MAG TPA: hypothetical protein VHA52_05925 [Candidatus Babeliaceae bacterium]|nr:hypothetical protein [Candidatus Babeliaceae bacterium]
MQLTESHYKFVMNMHMKYEKTHLGLVLMDSKGPAYNHLFGIVDAGVGKSQALAMNMIFTSLNIDLKHVCYGEERMVMEEKYRAINNFHYSRAVMAAQTSRYKAGPFSRLSPFVFVGVFTVWVEVAFSMIISIHFSVLVGFFSAAMLLISTFFLARTIKKWPFFNLTGG